jgi:hypothetical protein
MPLVRFDQLSQAITVTGLLDKPSTIDSNKIKIDIPQIELPLLDFSEPPNSSDGAIQGVSP